MFVVVVISLTMIFFVKYLFKRKDEISCVIYIHVFCLLSMISLLNTSFSSYKSTITTLQFNFLYDTIPLLLHFTSQVNVICTVIVAILFLFISINSFVQSFLCVDI